MCCRNEGEMKNKALNERGKSTKLNREEKEIGRKAIGVPWLNTPRVRLYCGNKHLCRPTASDIQLSNPWE